jgi:uncharacterized membrane protein
MKTLIIFICFSIAGLITAFGDFASKKWLIHDSKGWLAIGYLAYMCGVPLWFYGFKQSGQIAKMSCLWSVSIAIAAALVGIFYFHERPTTINLIGMGLGLTGLVMISLK